MLGHSIASSSKEDDFKNFQRKKKLLKYFDMKKKIINIFKNARPWPGLLADIHCFRF